MQTDTAFQDHQSRDEKRKILPSGHQFGVVGELSGCDICLNPSSDIWRQVPQTEYAGLEPRENSISYCYPSVPLIICLPLIPELCYLDF